MLRRGGEGAREEATVASRKRGERREDCSLRHGFKGWGLSPSSLRSTGIEGISREGGEERVKDRGSGLSLSLSLRGCYPSTWKSLDLGVEGHSQSTPGSRWANNCVHLDRPSAS